MAMNIIFPPTPESSIPSPTDASYSHTQQFDMIDMYPSTSGKSQPGPSKYTLPSARDLSPTPPAEETVDFEQLSLSNGPFLQRESGQLGRRPLSVSTPNDEDIIAFTPPRKLTDPNPRGTLPYLQQQYQARQPLDVDLDAYSTEYGDSREPTLSFDTTSTNESTTGTPSLVGYKQDGEGSSTNGEARIRMRSTAGRSTAYSSAGSSGAYSYHACENQVFHPHPPPLPTTPQPYNERIGLGISQSQMDRPADPGQKADSFDHRPWQSAVNRLRSTSNASSSTQATTSSQGYNSSLRHYEYHYNEVLPWEIQQAQDGEPEAVAMVEEGRERTLDMSQLEEMGGLDAMNEEKIATLSGVTHLLLSRCGTDLVQILPSLLSVLAPTLVVLDISHNAFTTLPDELRQCLSLEELNVSSNPLRAIPSFIGGLFNLRQIQFDQCTLQALPVELQNLASLHTLCLRRNRLVSLPAWLCQLDSLETLKVDENPFAREWIPIVAPILTRSDCASCKTPSPYIPPRASSSQPHQVRTAVSSASLASSINSAQSVKDFVSSSSPVTPADTLTPPISAAPSTTHLSPLDAIAEDAGPGPLSAPLSAPEPFNDTHPRMKRMKSAGNLFDQHVAQAPPPRARMQRAESEGIFATPSSTSSRANPSSAGSTSRGHTESPPDPSAASSSKTGKWGFLRKMSMNRLRSNDKTVTLSNSAAANVKLMPAALPHAVSAPLHTLERPSLRSAVSAMTLPNRNGSALDVSEFGQSRMIGPSSTLPVNGLPGASSTFGGNRSRASSRGKRRSFLPIDTPPSISISIPSTSPLMPTEAQLDDQSAPPSENGHSVSSRPSTALESFVNADPEADARYAAALESIKSYLRDLFDLGRPEIEPYGGFEVVNNGPETPQISTDSPRTISSAGRSSVSETRRTDHSDIGRPSMASDGVSETPSSTGRSACGKKFKDDKAKRAKVLREIYETERTYVRGLGELVTIYVRPSGQPVTPGKQPFESVVPSAERKIVFGGIESILTIHRDNLLPALERAIRDLIENGDDDEGFKSANTSHGVGEVFRTYIAYMKQYSTYINNFDNAMSRMKTWTTPVNAATTSPGLGSYKATNSPGSGIGSAAVGASMSAVSLPVAETVPHTGSGMSTSQRKRVKAFLKRCRTHPMHSQINLESYLLLPIQRVPRYKLLLEDLAMCTPPKDDGHRDTLDDALTEISSLASLMNEEKREADSRLRLYHWQKRITSKGPSPLVQPHRKLILDGSLVLIRLVKKAASYVEVDNTVVTDGEATIMPSKVVVPVEHIVPEPLDKTMVLILCSDMLVLAQRRPGEGEDGRIDLFNVLRLSTVRAPASVINDTILRVVDNRSIYYFQAENESDSLKWCRAINSARKR